MIHTPLRRRGTLTERGGGHDVDATLRSHRDWDPLTGGPANQHQTKSNSVRIRQIDRDVSRYEKSLGPTVTRPNATPLDEPCCMACKKVMARIPSSTSRSLGSPRRSISELQLPLARRA